MAVQLKQTSDADSPLRNSSLVKDPSGEGSEIKLRSGTRTNLLENPFNEKSNESLMGSQSFHQSSSHVRGSFHNAESIE